MRGSLECVTCVYILLPCHVFQSRWRGWFRGSEGHSPLRRLAPVGVPKRARNLYPLMLEECAANSKGRIRITTVARSSCLFLFGKVVVASGPRSGSVLVGVVGKDSRRGFRCATRRFCRWAKLELQGTS